MSVEFGVVIPTWGPFGDPAKIRTLILEAEALEYDSGGRIAELVPRPCPLLPVRTCDRRHAQATMPARRQTGSERGGNAKIHPARAFVGRARRPVASAGALLHISCRDRSIGLRMAHVAELFQE